MRQDLIQKYANVMPTMSDFLKKGVSATGNGLLTQAPPNTGAGGIRSQRAHGPECTGR